MHDSVTWYKITHAGEQVAKWDFQNNATRTSPPGPAFVLEVPLRNLHPSMCDFVPRDRIVERAYRSLYRSLYNNQINARALIGQSVMVYCAGKLIEKSLVF